MFILLLIIILSLIIVTLLIFACLYSVRRSRFENLATEETIDAAYDRFKYGDILVVPLSTVAGRVLLAPIADFFHYVIVVKVPGDDAKYILHTRNPGIKPLLYPNLEANVKTLGRDGTYQLVHLKEYLTYLRHRNNLLLHLATNQSFDYTLDYRLVHRLKRWKSYLSRHCGYLLMDYLVKSGWSKQTMYPSSNILYYAPAAIQNRLLTEDGYSERAVLRLV